MVAGKNDILHTDEQLAEAIAKRDRSEKSWQAARDACGQLYKRHSRNLLAYLAARVKRSDLEDVHQEVWERAWRHLPEGFRGGSFRAWLYQIARNHVIDQSRRKRPEPLSDEIALVDPSHGPADDLLVERERMVILNRCMQVLSPDAAALVRARLAGESYEDICARMKLKLEYAHKIFHKAKEQLQTCVERATL